MTPETRDADLYGKEYYDHYLGPVPYDREEPSWRNHFRALARHLVDRFAPRRTLDVGCAKGFLVEHLRDLGVEAYGTDVSPYAISQVREDVRPFCRVADATEPSRERFDLVTCIEVAEHLAPEDASRLVENLCAAADEIVFSSTPDDFRERTHRNVQPASYWRAEFAARGFFPNLHFESGFVAPHAIHFRRLRRTPIRIAVFSREKEDHAVVRLRLLDPLRALEAAGRAEIEFVSIHRGEIDVERILGAEVFVVHREFADRRSAGEVLAAARALGRPVVFEIDDLLHQVPHTNPAFASCAPITGDLLRMYGEADFVTVSTDPLRAEIERVAPAARGRTYVARNCIHPEIWGSDPPEPPASGGGPLVVGWVGSPTHADDLAVVEDAVGYLARKHAGRVVFRFWGFLPPSLEGVDGVTLVRGLVPDLSRHALEMRGQRIDLAIAPLRDTAFNRAKSDVKWLEYSICGIPSICSNVGPYAASIVHGATGWLVENTAGAWVGAIERLLGDEAMRRALAANAFREVREGACLDVAASQWDDLYGAFAVSGRREGNRTDGPAGDEAAAEAAAALFRLQAKIRHGAGDVAGAARSLEASIALEPESADRAIDAGVAWMEAGHSGAAETVLAAAARASNAKAHLPLARLHRGLDDPVREETALRAGARSSPRDREGIRALADFLAEAGREGEIREATAPFVAAERSFEDLVADAQFLAGIGRPEEALEMLRASNGSAAVDLGPLVRAIETVRDHARPATPPALLSDGSPRPLRVAVYTTAPLPGARVQRRLGGPLRSLERAGIATVSWSDGVVNRRAFERADLVLLHSPFAGSGEAGSLVEAAKAGGTKIVVEIDEPDLPDGERLAALRAVLRETEAVTVPDAGLRARLTDRIPEVADRIHVLETALDLEIWPGRGPREEDPRGLSTLALFPTEGSAAFLRSLLRALRPWIRRRPRLRLATWLAEDSADRVPPGSRSVTWMSAIYREHARRLQAAPIDLALVPEVGGARSLHEPLRLELAACRIPALFAAAGDPGEWIAAVEALLEDPRRRREIADRAWEEVLGERTLPQCAGRWADVFRRLVEHPIEEALATP